jgi:putative phosphoribosyl transferase
MVGNQMIDLPFENRQEAGHKLAKAVSALKLQEPIVLALPRGGVPVAAEIATALDAPLEVLVVRKVGAPGNPELAAAALVAGDPPVLMLNPEIVEAFALSGTEIEQMASAEQPELERRSRLYLRGRRPIPVSGRTVIMVDDGVATGTTMKAALRSLRQRGAGNTILAVPVAPPSVVEELREEADMIVCLRQPKHFRALSLHYREFDQVSDSEVLNLLAKSESAFRVLHREGA